MWHRSIVNTVEHAKERGLCLYGAGYWGEVAYRVFKKMGCTPLCYCDDNSGKWSTRYQGLPVYSLEEAIERYPNAIYIVCIDVTKQTGTWNRIHYNKMLHRLKDLGVYDSHSELRVIMYIFLLDIEEGTSPVIDSSADVLFEANDLKNLLVLNHMSNSGSYYLEQLLDGHPNILCLPYGGETFLTAYENRLKYLEGQELILEMTAQMLGYLHSQFEHLYCVREHKFEEYCADANGKFIHDVLIDPGLFVHSLILQFKGESKLRSFGHMLKVYVAAYNNCFRKNKQDYTSYWLFFQMHKPDMDLSDLYHFFDHEDFERVENLVIIREPVQQCYSWVRRVAMKQRRNTLLKKDSVFYYVLRSEMGRMLEKKSKDENVHVIRFEDLKYQPENILKVLCKWLDIPFLDILLSTTLNGFQIYFPTYTEEGTKYITGNDMTAVMKKDFSEVLTLWDEARLNLIYANFKHAYGYENCVPPFTDFSKEALEEFMKADFKFATIVQNVLEETGNESELYDVNQFVKDLYMEYMIHYKNDTEYYDYLRPE